MKKSTKPTFGSELRRLRRSDPRNLNLADAADQIGISVSYMSDIERDARPPLATDRLRKLLKYYGAEEQIAKFKVLAIQSQSSIEMPIIKNPKQAEVLAALARRTEAGDPGDDFWDEFMRLLGEKKE